MEQTKEVVLAVPVMLNTFQIFCFCTHPLFGMKKMNMPSWDPTEYSKKQTAMTLLPCSSHWQNTQRKDKFLCEETVRGLNDSELWDVEAHITRSPALIGPRLVGTESLSRLSSLPVYLKELIASAQQIPVGRDLSQHAPGIWIATFLLQNLPNTRNFFCVIIVLTERPSTCLHSKCDYFPRAVLINPFWKRTHTGRRSSASIT